MLELYKYIYDFANRASFFWFFGFQQSFLRLILRGYTCIHIYDATGLSTSKRLPIDGTRPSRKEVSLPTVGAAFQVDARLHPEIARNR